AQWSDSSLGCRRPGLMYQQVITNGYVVVLERQGRQHRVNVAGERAVMCEAPTRASVRRPMQARGLTQMTELARSDLAARLKLDVAAIRVTQIEPQRWTDSDMNCGPSQTPATATETAGYRLALTAADRVYLYHTDLKTVRPCPPVEDQ
ncbi:MAG TPA: hypothetical protein VKB34_06985, partial [Povalibacter sp.]|nr:hypothetical protein [Povalibacter sp.]